MAKFTIEGLGAHSAERLEKTASTAQEALTLYGEMRRLCGKLGDVQIRVEQGKIISAHRLQTLALREQDGAPG